MLGRVNPQGSLLETRHARRHLVTKGSFYERLADNGDAFLCDDDYAHLYAPTMGRPSIPPSIMVRAMLLATYERVRSDAEIARNTRVDLDWKAAMGVDDDFGGIAPTTFSLMRARMVAADADAKLFEKTLEKAVAAGIFGNQKLTAIVDSSPVHGAGAVSDTYELIRGFLRQAVKAAAGRLSEATSAATVGFLGAKPDIDWQDPQARKQHLGELVAAARMLVAEASAIDDPGLAEAAGMLAQVVAQDTEDDEEGDPKIRQGVAKDRVISTSDPQDAPRPQVGLPQIRRLQEWTSSPTRAPSWCWEWRSAPATPATGRGRPLCLPRCRPSRASRWRGSLVTWPTPTGTPGWRSSRPVPSWWPRSPR